MPRNSSGVYSLPAGNPVVTGTTISSVWANTTLSDIGTALTDSLSRSGDGGMTAPLELDDGAIGAPGLTWTTEPTSGLYRAGAGDFRYSVGAADALQILAGSTRFVGGSVGTPGIGFITDSNTGLFLLGADNLGVAVGGSSALDISSARVAVTASALWAPNGTVGAPSYSFANDNNTGIYWGGADNLRIVTAGILALEIGDAQRLWAVNGTAVAPAYSFASDTNTGIYAVSADVLGFAAGGTLYAQLQSTRLALFASQLQSQDGSASVPAFSFTSDSNTGIYRSGADELAFATAGAVAGLFRASGVFQVVDGAASEPSFSFINDTDTGVYRITSNSVGIAAGGSLVAQFRNVAGALAVTIDAGSSANPSLAFSSDTNTGLYRGGSDDIRICAGGNDMFIADSINNTMRIGKDSSTVTNFFTATSASASAGGGAAIPATVTGFMTVLINGSTRKIPYYNS